ncbi:MAG TPA: hypothetical protein VKK31_08410 [Thermoanaerobaculia bacterium]|nr:hypothetical protein [Thermoanaerobaculia bacterium]
MRKLNLAILGTLLLCAATAAWAADAPAVPATAAVLAEAGLVAPAPPPVSIDLLFSSPQSVAVIPCPTEPITTCNDCFYFGQYLTYRCTTFCQNGVPRRTCGSCGSGCNP